MSRGSKCVLTERALGEAWSFILLFMREDAAYNRLYKEYAYKTKSHVRDKNNSYAYEGRSGCQTALWGRWRKS